VSVHFRPFAGLALAVAACMQPLAANAQVPPPPGLETDAIGLWEQANTAEREAKASGALITDPALNAYLREVMCRVAAEQCGEIRLYVMDRPAFNALMAPNGYSEIWSGLLLRARDEAEVAFVLAHEATHYDEDHSIAMLRTVRGRANRALMAGMVIAVAGAAAAANSPNNAGNILDASSVLSDAVYLGTLASVFGFSRENEEAADREGFERSLAAGYDPRAGETLWQSLVAEVAASDYPAVRRSLARNSIFATHPVTAERIAALRAQAEAQGTSAGNREAARYRAAIRPFLIPWLRTDLRRRDFGQTMHLIARLREGGEDLGVLGYMEGEAYRLRRQDGDTARAQTAYSAAITHADAPAEAWRELGVLERRAGNISAARAHFSTYLARAPTAADAALIAEEVQALTAREGQTP
jgi:Zn-dependent protease with chaperone function